jgi:hydroxyacylglutathione hydrolase
VGYDNVLGFLKGGIAAWKNDGRDADSLESISAEEFAKRMNAEKLNVIDVRKPSEWEAEHLEHAKHASLQFLNDNMAEFSKDKTNYVHCAGGYRSMIAATWPGASQRSRKRIWLPRNSFARVRLRSSTR